jgi:hypothetical protein
MKEERSDKARCYHRVVVVVGDGPGGIDRTECVDEEIMYQTPVSLRILYCC